MSAAYRDPDSAHVEHLPFGFSSAEEYETWLADLHSAQDMARKTAAEVDKREAELLADMAREGAGIFGGIPLPESARDLLAHAKRIASFMPYVPDTMKGKWGDTLAEIVSLAARALGV